MDGTQKPCDAYLCTSEMFTGDTSERQSCEWWCEWLNMKYITYIALNSFQKEVYLGTVSYCIAVPGTNHTRTVCGNNLIEYCTIT